MTATRLLSAALTFGALLSDPELRMSSRTLLFLFFKDYSIEIPQYLMC